MVTMQRQLRRLGLGHDDRGARIATIDEEFYRWTQWIFLQIYNSWYDESAEGGRGRARPIAELEAAAGRRASAPTPDGRAWSELSAAERRAVIDDAAAGLPVRGAGQLVPRSGHRAGQRGGHRRRPQSSAATSRCSSAACASG